MIWIKSKNTEKKIYFYIFNLEWIVVGKSARTASSSQQIVSREICSPRLLFLEWYRIAPTHRRRRSVIHINWVVNDWLMIAQIESGSFDVRACEHQIIVQLELAIDEFV